MNKKLAAALSGGAVLVLALSACSSDDSGKKVNDWAKTFCDQAQPQIKKITDANAAIEKQTADESKPADVQKTDSTAFQQISDAYKALADSINKAGAPPVKDGDKTQQEAAKELTASSASYADLKKKVDALDTGDQAKFADGLKGVADQLNTISKSSDDALKKLESGDLGKAMQKQPGCQKQTPSTTSSPAAGGGASKDASPAASASKGAKPSDSAKPSESAKPSDSAKPSASSSGQ
ncbi:small secreted protein [Streptomyces sp. CBMA152]|uniref:small secreted protein n=1 Tax=Streptomyces sp. CBMA152 TaxID=1896312 RepID=UPI001660EC62|nr:small secreted protein [Streptomyces sp. CBMA152]MBD0742056.1 small secreted protein [Streptomyces sp. CBMA152]